jgi:hypothetical protein
MLMVGAPRDELSSIISHLQQQVGARQPGSAAEATAAAYINARLRRVGARVGTQAVPIPAYPHRTATAIYALAVCAALIAPWLPLPALLLAGWAYGALIIDQMIAPLPRIGPRLESQNVFGTRAVTPNYNGEVRAPRWRVLLLARLDTPAAPQGLRQLLAPTSIGLAAKLFGPALVLAAAIAAMVTTVFAWVLTVVAVAYLMLLIGITLLPPAPSDSSAADTALATLVPAMAHLSTLHQVELWAIALGATDNGSDTVTMLLRHFPFDPATTLVIGVEALVGAQLAYATREGALRGWATSREVLRLADAADAADTTIDAEPRPFRSDGGMTAPFRRRRFRTLTLFGAPGNGEPIVSGHLLAEQAVRLITGIVEQLDGESGEAVKR